MGRAGRLAWGLHLWLVVASLVLDGAAGQTCSASDIMFPEQQCTLPCPGRSIESSASQCSQSSYLDKATGTSYCCLCIDKGDGSQELKLCPSSADPARMPTPPVAPAILASGDLSNISEDDDDFDTGLPSKSISADVFLAPGNVTTLRLLKASDAASWGALDQLEIIISNVVAVAPSASTLASPATGASSACNSTNATANCTLSNSTRRAGPGYTRSGGGVVVWRQGWNKFSSVVGPDLAADGNQDAARQMAGEVRESHEEALRGGGGLQHGIGSGGIVSAAKLQSGADDAQDGEGSSSRRFFWPKTPSKSALMWVIQAGGAPDMSQTPALFDYMSFGASSVSVLDYNPLKDYYVTLNVTAPGNWYRATLTFGKRRVIQLGLKRQSSFRVLPDSRVFTQFRPGVEGLVVLTMTVNNPKNVRSRIWSGASSNSGMAGVATERSWIKWVGGNDTEINAITNKFYTAIHLSAGFGMTTASWMFQCQDTVDWRITPAVVAPVDIKLDEPVTFSIIRSEGAALFRIPSDGTTRENGAVYLQIMPSSTPESRAAFPDWPDLERAMRMVATTQFQSQLQYISVSQWGKTSDGTPGLLISVSDWDAGSDIYLQIFLEDSAPSNSFTLVSYQISSPFEAWKWWFMGIVLAVFIVFVARCVLCRTLYRRLEVGGPFAMNAGGQQGRFGGGMEIGGDGGATAVPERTTSLPIPTKLRKVADTLYKRVEDAPAGSAVRAPTIPLGRSTSIRGDKVSEDGEEIEVDTEEAGDGGLPGGQEAAAGAGGTPQDEEEEKSCIVCLDRERNALLLECGHGGLCVPCADALWRSGPAFRNCPMCREVFTGVMKIVGEEAGEISVEVVHYASTPVNKAPKPRGALGMLRSLARTSRSGERERDQAGAGSVELMVHPPSAVSANQPGATNGAAGAGAGAGVGGGPAGGEVAAQRSPQSRQQAWAEGTENNATGLGRNVGDEGAQPRR